MDDPADSGNSCVFYTERTSERVHFVRKWRSLRQSHGHCAQTMLLQLGQEDYRTQLQTHSFTAYA